MTINQTGGGKGNSNMTLNMGGSGGQLIPLKTGTQTMTFSSGSSGTNVNGANAGHQNMSFTMNGKPMNISNMQNGSFTFNGQPINTTGMQTSSFTLNGQPINTSGMQTGSFTVNGQQINTTGHQNAALGNQLSNLQANLQDKLNAGLQNMAVSMSSGGINTGSHVVTSGTPTITMNTGNHNTPQRRQMGGHRRQD